MNLSLRILSAACMLLAASHVQALEEAVPVCIAENSEHYQSIGENLCQVIDKVWVGAECQVVVKDPSDAFGGLLEQSNEPSCFFSVGLREVAYPILGKENLSELTIQSAEKRRTIDLSLLYEGRPDRDKIGVLPTDPQAELLSKQLKPEADIVILGGDNPFDLAKERQVTHMLITGVQKWNSDLKPMAVENDIDLVDAGFTRPESARWSFATLADGMTNTRIISGWKNTIIIAAHERADPDTIEYLRYLLPEKFMDLYFLEMRGEIDEVIASIQETAKRVPLFQFIIRQSEKSMDKMEEILTRHLGDNENLKDVARGILHLTPENREKAIRVMLAAGEITEESAKTLRDALRPHLWQELYASTIQRANEMSDDLKKKTVESLEISKCFLLSPFTDEQCK